MRLNNTKGFTLIEFIVVFAISGVLAIGLYMAYRSNIRSFNVNQDILEMQMNARTAISTITRDLRMVGFGSKILYKPFHPEGAVYNSLYLDPSHNDEFNSNLVFFKSGNNSSNDTTAERSDSIAVTYGSRYIGKISSIIDQKTITLDDTSILSDNVTKYQHYNIYIFPDAYQENFQISNKSGTTLTLQQNHHAQIQDECYLLQSKYIRLVDHNIRIDNNISLSTANNDIVENIEAMEFQFALDSNNNGSIEPGEWQNNFSSNNVFDIKGFKIFILARTANTDPDYIDTQIYSMADQTFGPFNDHYHRLLLTSTVIPRNLYY